jgi:ATP-binding cassette subfamily B protein
MNRLKPNSQKRHTTAVVRYYWLCVRKYPRDVAGVLVGIPIVMLVNVYLPSLVLADVLSRLSQSQFEAGQIWSSFGPSLLAYAGLLVGGLLVWRCVDFFVWRLEMNAQQDIAEHVFKHLLSRGADFHANNFSGSLVSQSNKLISGYVRMADTTIFQTYPMIAGLVIAVTILLQRAPVAAAALLVFAVTFIVIALVVARPVIRIGAVHANVESKQTGFLADAVANVMTIKSFARNSYEIARFHKTTTETKDNLRKFSRAHRGLMNRLGLMSRTISASALFIAVVAVMQFDANIGTVFLIFSYASFTVEGLFQFSNAGLRNYNRTIGEASDMVEILAQKPEIEDPAKPEPVRINRGAIRFEDVTFTHNGADDAIFDGLNLSIKPGEKIGLIGHSGSGKSTFTRLLLRFSDIQGGEIKLDGQNIARITQEDLHSRIAYVPQEPLLFHRTIRENIAYGQADADDKAVFAAAKMASAHEFIQALPQGYDTLVGERGVKLSGGQRQRVAIARAMLKNAPILLLDEATSALDSESEVLIQAALWKLMEGRTAIVIAHRLSTIQKMDRILVMDNGKIVEQGSHKELLHVGGTYAKLWAHQSGGFIDE